MYTLPLNLAQNFNKNNVQNLSFSASFAFPSGVSFKDDKKDIFNFSKRYEEIKKINPDKTSIIKLMRLDDEEYGSVLNAIYKFPKRERALLDKDSKLSFSKTKDTFNGITDKRLGLSFSNGYGFYNIVNTSNDYGDLHTSRESSYLQGKSIMNFTDKSRFNEDYFIENAYSKNTEHSNDFKTVETRNISIKGNKFYPILDYSYSKKHFKNSDHIEFNVNGRNYSAKINNDGKVTIRSGSKWGKLDFSKALELIPESGTEKEAFIGALKMLPPQVLFELNVTLKPFLKNAQERRELSLECFSDVIKQVPEENREAFVDALKTALPQMLAGLEYTLLDILFAQEDDDTDKNHDNFSGSMPDVPEGKRKIIIETLKTLPRETISELKDNISALNKKKNRSLRLLTPVTAADSMINLTIERLSDKNGLTNDKQLNKIFEEEKENFIKWLEEDSDGRIRKDAESYMKNNLKSEKELMEVIKSVCNLLWMEEYDENRVDDEGKRLLLNFFP